jgi:hypothetical protein
VCRGCGACTQPRNGEGLAYAYRKACHPGSIARRWPRERVLEAMGEWLDRDGGRASEHTPGHGRQRLLLAHRKRTLRPWLRAVKSFRSMRQSFGAAAAAGGLVCFISDVQPQGIERRE